MRLVNAHVKLYKSIDDSGSVTIDPKVTVLVGQNESGKTAFLHALNKANSVDPGTGYSVIDDYPRKDLTRYQKVHAIDPVEVAVLRYLLEDDEISEFNKALGFQLVSKLEFTVYHKYNNTSTVGFQVPEIQYIKDLVAKSNLTIEHKGQVTDCRTIRELMATLARLELNSEEQQVVANLTSRFGNTPDGWHSLQYYVWINYIKPNIPKFLYFDDYYLLPGKINLATLQQRVQAQANGGNALQDEDKTVLGLLRMAGVDVKDLTDTAGYEEIKAKLEAISNSITDQVFQYWTQNRELDVEFDIRTDPSDQPPYNNGSNLYIRIRNRRHRVTVPFSQRSKGFIWFFSFLVWFDSIQQQVKSKSPLLLLLDEPGLSLHALAQEDFLRYIDDLSGNHQIIYTTHSPFMVHSDRLHQVRTVEDRDREGTKIGDNISGSDPKTVFPLQAALGYTVAQNLFISKRNLLVEGPADLIYLRFFSQLLELQARTCLRDDVTIVPTGGLDKIATFIALLGANELKIVVLHDYENKPDARIQSLIEDKLIKDKNVLNYAMYRTGSSPGAYLNSDVEDLISPDLYLELFSTAYAKNLGGARISESDLPPGDRIVDRVNRYLKAQGITLRKSGGFNHYLVANHLATNPVNASRVDESTLSQFEKVFAAVNQLV